MIEEEEMEKQVNNGTFDECAYVKDDDDLFNVLKYLLMLEERSILHIMQFKKQQNIRYQKKRIR